MRTMTSAEARQNFASVLDDAEPVAITRRGQPTKAIVDLEEYKALKELKLDKEFEFLFERNRDAYKELADK